MAKTVFFLLLFAGSPLFAQDTRIYSEGNVTQVINPSSSGTHILKTGGANLTLDPNGGNVGIGTTGPGATLDISSSASTPFRVNQTSGNGYLRLNRAATTQDSTLTWQDAGSDVWYLGQRNTDGVNSFHLYSAAKTGGAGDVVTVLNTGNVGINTTVPGKLLDVNGAARAATYETAGNCSSSASPAVCAASAAGSVVVAAAATTVVVNTTVVTANSQILLTEDSSLGTKLSVICNTTTGRTYTVSARTAATSFTITASAAPVTNPACLSYLMVN